MRLFPALVLLAVLAPGPLHSIAFAQKASSVVDTDKPADPLQVKPVKPAARPTQETPEASAIHAKLVALGYSNISGLDRDTAGIWHAHATKDNAGIEVTVDKGGRILPR